MSAGSAAVAGGAGARWQAIDPLLPRPAEARPAATLR